MRYLLLKPVRIVGRFVDVKLAAGSLVTIGPAVQRGQLRVSWGSGEAQLSEFTVWSAMRSGTYRPARDDEQSTV